MKGLSGGRVVGAGASGRASPRRAFTTMSMPSNPEAPPTSGTITTAMRDFADAWQALAEPTHMAYAQDANHQREMILMTSGLAPRADCTHVAVQNGNWTGSTTWMSVSTRDFAIPGAGAKLGVPAGITVTMDNNSTTVFSTLRVDGTVTYPRAASTQLYIDTIVVNHGGVWDMGTEASPLTSAYTHEVVFPDGGDIDTTLVTGDYLLLGRGFLGMGATLAMPENGSISMVGPAKTKWATTAQTRTVGATTITVDSLPADWEVGDEIYIAGTILGGYYRANSGYVTEDRNYDKATITGLDSGTKTITFTPALAHARSVPSSFGGFEDVKYHVANLTRNIRFRSPDGTLVHRKGHMMVMGENIHIENVEWKNLGRTRKDFDQVGALGGGNDLPDPSFDATDDDARETIEGVGQPWSADANVRGRYPLHVHRSGILGMPSAAIIKGNAVNTAPGWGVAIHQSNATVTDNVCVEYSGAGFMAELGNEYGTWEGNFAAGGNVTNGDVQAQKLSNNSDFGLFGDAFWFKGRQPVVLNNVAADCHIGYSWMARHNAPGSGISAPVTPEPRIFYGYDQTVGALGVDIPVIHNFKGNICYSASYGASVIKAQANQSHGYRSNFFNFICWELGLLGIDLDYTGAYSIKDVKFHFSSKVTSDPNVKASGVIAQSTTNDAFIDGVTVRSVRNNFRGVTLSKGGVFNPGNDNRNGLVSDRISVPSGASLFRLSGGGVNGGDFTTLGGPYDTDYIILTDTEAADVTLEFQPASEPVFLQNGPASPDANIPGFVIEGNLTTELGTKPRTHEDRTSNTSLGICSQFSWIQLREMVARYGYYTYSGANYVLVPDLISKHRLDVNGDVQIRYLTLVLKIAADFTRFNLSDYTNQGALPTRYVDAITGGTYVVYEDIFGTGNLYEGL